MLLVQFTLYDSVNVLAAKSVCSSAALFSKLPVSHGLLFMFHCRPVSNVWSKIAMALYCRICHAQAGIIV